MPHFSSLSIVGAWVEVFKFQLISSSTFIFLVVRKVPVGLPFLFLPVEAIFTSSRIWPLLFLFKVRATPGRPYKVANAFSRNLISFRTFSMPYLSMIRMPLVVIRMVI